MESERVDAFMSEVDKSNAITEKWGCTSFPRLVTRFPGLFFVGLPVHHFLNRQGGPDRLMQLVGLEGRSKGDLRMDCRVEAGGKVKKAVCIIASLGWRE